MVPCLKVFSTTSSIPNLRKKHIYGVVPEFKRIIKPNRNNTVGTVDKITSSERLRQINLIKNIRQNNPSYVINHWTTKIYFKYSKVFILERRAHWILAWSRVFLDSYATAYSCSRRCIFFHFNATLLVVCFVFNIFLITMIYIKKVKIKEKIILKIKFIKRNQ